MAKNIEVAVVCQNFEALVTNAVPLIHNLFDFEHLSPRLAFKGEAKGPFISLVT
jgi:hypothetical protein